MSLAPVVTFWDKELNQQIGTPELDKWHVKAEDGTDAVKAGDTSEVLNLRIWNNKGETVQRASKMQECRLYIVDHAGNRGIDAAPIAKDGWLWARCEHLDAEFIQIHENEMLPFYGQDSLPTSLEVGAVGLSEDDFDSIGGEVNGGQESDNENYSDVDLYFKPSNDPHIGIATHGPKDFKIVVEYFYV